MGSNQTFIFFFQVGWGRQVCWICRRWVSKIWRFWEFFFIHRGVRFDPFKWRQHLCWGYRVVLKPAIGKQSDPTLFLCDVAVYLYIVLGLRLPYISTTCDMIIKWRHQKYPPYSKTYNVAPFSENKSNPVVCFEYLLYIYLLLNLCYNFFHYYTPLLCTKSRSKFPQSFLELLRSFLSSTGDLLGDLLCSGEGDWPPPFASFPVAFRRTFVSRCRKLNNKKKKNLLDYDKYPSSYNIFHLLLFDHTFVIVINYTSKKSYKLFIPLACLLLFSILLTVTICKYDQRHLLKYE